MSMRCNYNYGPPPPHYYGPPPGQGCAPPSPPYAPPSPFDTGSMNDLMGMTMMMEMFTYVLMFLSSLFGAAAPQPEGGEPPPLPPDSTTGEDPIAEAVRRATAAV